ncbi:FAD-dependent monooxygenase [Litorivita sp. NS0012-18]|uniref:FAD-dependent monooxygenase n=1 Tax=Litorivita sp. NS0012-18 TaxID=3127655 RepID=UPI00310670D6
MSILGMEIAVIGAGIGGLAAAQALAQRGAQVTVLEQAEAIREVGAGLQVSPNGAAVLEALGLGEALRAASVRAQAVSLRDYRGACAEVLRLDLTRLKEQSYYFTHRADLIDILAKGARECGVQIRLLQKVVSVSDAGSDAGSDRRAQVHMANGDRMSADLVIDAGGLHGQGRAVLNRAAEPFFTGQVAWRATVENSDAELGGPDLGGPDLGGGFDVQSPEARVYMGPQRHLVCYPLRGGARLNIVAVQERSLWAEEDWSHQDDPSNLRAAFADFGPQVQQILARVDEVHLWGLFRHPVAEHWHGSALALLGDAAHPTLPFLAQGASMALEDAWVLGDALAHSDSLGAGLAAYQARRRPRALRVIEAASKNAWKYHLGHGPVRFGAHLALRLGGALAPERMMRSFDWLYAHDVTKTGGAA